MSKTAAGGLMLAVSLTLFTFTAGADWAVFRGSRGLTGFTDERLPENPRLIWKYRTGDIIRSSPVTAGGRIFIGSGDGRLYALEQETGRLVWAFDTGSQVDSPPLVLHDTVIFSSVEGTIHAAAAETGKLIWSFRAEGQIYGSANYFLASGKIYIVFGCYDGRLYCIDFETGKSVWTYQTESFINGTPAVWGNSIIFGGCDAGVYMLNSRGELRARVDTGSYIAASAAAGGGYIYTGNYSGKVTAIDINKKEIAWEFTEEDRAPSFFSSAAISAGQLVIGGRDNRLYCLDRKTGSMLWYFEGNGHMDASPVIAGNRVVFGSKDGRVYILELSSGREVWSYEIGEPVFSSCAVSGGMIFFGADDGYIYAFGEKR